MALLDFCSSRYVFLFLTAAARWEINEFRGSVVSLKGRFQSKRLPGKNRRLQISVFVRKAISNNVTRIDSSKWVGKLLEQFVYTFGNRLIAPDDEFRGSVSLTAPVLIDPRLDSNGIPSNRRAGKFELAWKRYSRRSTDGNLVLLPSFG